MSKDQAGLPTSGGGGPNVGAIAGGVIGGVVFIAVVTFVIWRFCIRPRYKNYETEEEDYSDEYAIDSEEIEKTSPRTIEGSFRPASQARQSHHSTRSVASTVMTRASNVIQIAFIPGITDRNHHNDSDSDIPPVPSIPLSQQRTVSSASSINRGNHPGSPDHFFTPADLAGGSGSRWSQFSNSTTDSEDIRSLRPQSLASSLARESVASTIFHDGQAATATATPIAASQVQGVRGRANMVSVKPSNPTSPPGAPGHVPEVPNVDYFKYGDAKNAAEAGDRKPHPLATSTTANGSEEKLATGDGEQTKKPSNRMLAVAIEEATRRASRAPTHAGLGGVGPGQGKSSQLAKPDEDVLRERDPSPFSDSNAVSTP